MLDKGCRNKTKLITSVLVVLTLLQACNKEEDAQEHLQKGVEYLNNGEYEKAQLELKTSNQANKDTADTYYYLALLDEKTRNFKVMKENLLKAIELSSDHVKARVKLGNLYILLGDIDSASQQAEAVLAIANQNEEALLLKASVEIGLKKYNEAVAVIDGVLKTNPKSGDAIALKSLLYSQQGDTLKALALIDDALKLDAKNVAWHIFKIQLHSNAKEQDAVINDFNNLIAAFPDNQEYKIMLVKEYARNGDDKQAEALITKIIAAAPKDVRPKLLLLDLIVSAEENKGSDKLAKQFNEFVEQYKTDAQTLLTFADWMSKRRDFDEANSVLNRILAIEKKSEMAYVAKIKLARNALDNNDVEKAAIYINEVLSANPDLDAAKIVQSRILISKKQFDEALGLLNKIDWSTPNSDEIKFLFGQAYLGKGDDEKAQAHFAKALELNPSNLDAFGFVYNSAMARKDVKYAKDLLEKTLKYLPSNLILLQQLGQLNVMNKDWNGSQSVVRAIANVENPLAKDLSRYLQAQVYQAQENYPKAIEIYKQLLDKFPENTDALNNMATCYEKLNKRQDMVAYLNGVLQKKPDNISAAVIMVKYFVEDKQFDKAAALLSQAIKTDMKNTKLYSYLAGVRLSQGDSKGMIAAYQEGIKNNPKDVELPLLLAGAYELQNNFAAAIEIYEKLLADNPKLEIAVNNLASILVDQFDDKEKIDKAVELSKVFKKSSQPTLKDTYGWALIKQGNIDEGLVVLKEVVTSAPDVPVFKYHLATALYKKGDLAAAKSEIKQAIDQAILRKLPDEQKKAELLLKELEKSEK